VSQRLLGQRPCGGFVGVTMFPRFSARGKGAPEGLFIRR